MQLLPIIYSIAISIALLLLRLLLYIQYYCCADIGEKAQMEGKEGSRGACNFFQTACSSIVKSRCSEEFMIW